VEREHIASPTIIPESTDFFGDASMDAASNIKTLLAALATSFGVTALAYGDDPDTKTHCRGLECNTASKLGLPQVEGVCCDRQVCEAGRCPACNCNSETVASKEFEFEVTNPKAGFPSFLSEWLSKSPKFSAEVAIHFGTTPSVQPKLNNTPVDIQVGQGQTGRFSVARAIKADKGESGTFSIGGFDFNITSPYESNANAVVPGIRQPITKPMKFTEQISRLQLGEFIGDVIICGHRICTGNKCYDVKDEPVAGTPCDKSDEVKVGTSESEEEEPILVLPLAPPAPPGGDIAQFSDSFSIENMNESEASSILRNSGLGNVNISLPVITVVDLLVAKTELSTRLEMTSQLMDERRMVTQEMQSLAKRNATLATQLAVAEARNQMSDALTASVLERAELAIKLASVESKSSKLTGSSSVVHSIQEDLSNIRRQIALLRKAPVPFAQSYVGKQIPLPYIPTAQLPASQLTREHETTCEGDDASESIPTSSLK